MTHNKRVESKKPLASSSKTATNVVDVKRPTSERKETKSSSLFSSVTKTTKNDTDEPYAQPYNIPKRSKDQTKGKYIL